MLAQLINRRRFGGVFWLGFAFFVAGLTVSGCGGGETRPSAEEIARQAAKDVLGPTVQSQFPGIPTDFVVDCVIDHATPGEILSIANAAYLGMPRNIVYAITPVLQKPRTIGCITQSAWETL